MADKLTKTQAELGNTLFEVTELHRTFSLNYGHSAEKLRRAIVHEVTIATGAGLVVGTLVGVLAGMRRR